MTMHAYQAIRLGGQEAPLVPPAELRRLQAAERLARLLHSTSQRTTAMERVSVTCRPAFG